MMKKIAVVTGAGGFIGHALVKRLKQDGFYVRGVSRRAPLFELSPADEFIKTDLRYLKPGDPVFAKADEVYQCAGNTGGIAYLDDAARSFELLHDNMRLNLAVFHSCLANRVGRLLFVSTGCVYPLKLPCSMNRDLSTDWSVNEAQAYPALCSNEFGWASLFVERLLGAALRWGKLNTRIVRLHSTYGPGAIFKGDKVRAPAAICRKLIESTDGGLIDVVGDGTQVRSFMYVDDAVEGLLRVMRGDCADPINVGSSEAITIQDLVWATAHIAGKKIGINYVPGAIGAQGRSSNNEMLRKVTGWEPGIKLSDGLRRTYEWIKERIAVAKAFELG